MSSLPQGLIDRHLRRSCQMAWAAATGSGSKDVNLYPVCYTSLLGLSEDAASVHVNGCLDATLTLTSTLQETPGDNAAVFFDDRLPIFVTRLNWYMGSQLVQVGNSAVIN